MAPSSGGAAASAPLAWPRWLGLPTVTALLVFATHVPTLVGLYLSAQWDQATGGSPEVLVGASAVLFGVLGGLIVIVRPWLLALFLGLISGMLFLSIFLVIGLLFPISVPDRGTGQWIELSMPLDDPATWLLTAIFLGPHLVSYLFFNLLVVGSGVVARRPRALYAQDVWLACMGLVCGPWALWLTFLDWRSGPALMMAALGVSLIVLGCVRLVYRVYWFSLVTHGRKPNYALVPRARPEDFAELPAFLPAFGALHRRVLVRREPRRNQPTEAIDVPVALAP